MAQNVLEDASGTIFGCLLVTLQSANEGQHCSIVEILGSRQSPLDQQSVCVRHTMVSTDPS